MTTAPPPGGCPFMAAALKQAQLAAGRGEVPVGAVVVVDGHIVARAHNEVEARRDATRHAELLALQRAAAALSRWRLNDAALYVTLEPCPMCLGAMLLTRLATLHFACPDPVQGASGSAFDISDHPGLPHRLEVFSGSMAAECSLLLSEFFRQLR